MLTNSTRSGYSTLAGENIACAGLIARNQKADVTATCSTESGGFFTSTPSVTKQILGGLCGWSFGSPGSFCPVYQLLHSSAHFAFDSVWAGIIS